MYDQTDFLFDIREERLKWKGLGKSTKCCAVLAQS